MTKDVARRILDRLPDTMTWEDLQYEIYVRQEVEAGLKDAAEGRTVSHDEVMKLFGLGPEKSKFHSKLHE